jgi:TonB family protein
VTLLIGIAASVGMHAAALWIAADLGFGAGSGNGGHASGGGNPVALSVRLRPGGSLIGALLPVEPEREALSAGNRPDTARETSKPDPIIAVPAQSGPLPGPAYHTPEVLTVRPRPIETIEPAYPFRTREVVRGRIILRLMINSGGTVDRVLVEESDLGSKFEDAAVSAFAAARFSPGQIDGTPVGSQMRVEVTFESDFASR